jgi:alpha-beta hydrolase superfamily lysophospholipase
MEYTSCDATLQHAQEHFMPYFSAHGVESFALSLRGHSGSDPVQAHTCSMADQLSDISSFVRGLPQAPVMIGHSIGGVIAQR